MQEVQKPGFLAVFLVTFGTATKSDPRPEARNPFTLQQGRGAALRGLVRNTRCVFIAPLAAVLAVLGVLRVLGILGVLGIVLGVLNVLGVLAILVFHESAPPLFVQAYHFPRKRPLCMEKIKKPVNFLLTNRKGTGIILLQNKEGRCIRLTSRRWQRGQQRFTKARKSGFLMLRGCIAAFAFYF